MNMHTPGPWTVKLKDKRFPIVLLGYRSGLLYADGSGSDESMKSQMRLTINIGPSPESLAEGLVSNRMETCIANAYLISASPDLLKALKIARERLIEFTPLQVKSWDSTRKEMKAMIEAIAKAEPQDMK